MRIREMNQASCKVSPLDTDVKEKVPQSPKIGTGIASPEKCLHSYRWHNARLNTRQVGIK